MFAKPLGFCLALAAAVALISASSAASAKTHAGIDVSTRAAVVDYLRSINVDPRGVVIERGTRNYAGPSCPGRGWTCATTTHPVVQVAAAGGANTFSCATARCAVVQVGTNRAVCIATARAAQTCTLSQTSATADNEAVVYENVANAAPVKKLTPRGWSIAQRATSRVSITQTATGDGNSNEACVYQAINLDRSATYHRRPVTLTQAAHQTVTIAQDSASGGNAAAESATRDGQCTGTSITQRQTVGSNLTGLGSITQGQSPADMTIDIEQNEGASFVGTASGENSANFAQSGSVTAVANSLAGPVRQTQGSGGGGLLATINQDSRDPSAVVAGQTEIQCEDAATSGLTTCQTHSPHTTGLPTMQKQHGAARVATSTQTGNGADTFTVDQSSTQDSDAGPSQSNLLHADLHTSGDSTVTQTAVENGTQNTHALGGPDVNAGTSCTGSLCLCAGPVCDVLIAGAGDETEPDFGENADLARLLTAQGYSVAKQKSLPTDLSGFREVWWVDTGPPTAAEQSQLVAFAQSGRGLFLTGENSCCSDLDAADQSMANAIVAGGGVTVGVPGVVGKGGTPTAMPVNPDVVGNLASQPNTITSWQVTAAGGLRGVPDSSVFSHSQPAHGSPVTIAAAWDRPSVVGSGRLVLFMDINWAAKGLRAANWSSVAENVAFFLSGLSSPPAK